jgi:hypothetical protein
MTTATGLRPPPSHQEWCAALHEAAHACVVIQHGGTFAAIELHDNNLTGKTRQPVIGDRLSAVVAALAGPTAEAIFAGADPAKVIRQPAAATDRQIALDALASGPRDHPGLTAMLQHAESVVRSARVPIVRLADALQQKRRVTYDQAKAIIKEAATMTGNQKQQVYDLARSMPHTWSDEYRLGLARNMLATGRASPQRQMAFDSAAGLRRSADAASAKGGTAMPVFSGARSTQDRRRGRDQSMTGMTPPPAPSGSQGGDDDVADLVGRIHQCYAGLDPDQQDQLVEGLGALIDHHANGGSANGDPDMTNGDEDFPGEGQDPAQGVGIRGTATNQLENTATSNQGSGAADRRRRRGGYDAYVSRSPASRGFAQRWPEMMRISVR